MTPNFSIVLQNALSKHPYSHAKKADTISLGAKAWGLTPADHGDATRWRGMTVGEMADAMSAFVTNQGWADNNLLDTDISRVVLDIEHAQSPLRDLANIPATARTIQAARQVWPGREIGLFLPVFGHWDDDRFDRVVWPLNVAIAGGELPADFLAPAGYIKVGTDGLIREGTENIMRVIEALEPSGVPVVPFLSVAQNGQPANSRRGQRVLWVDDEELLLDGQIADLDGREFFFWDSATGFDDNAEPWEPIERTLVALFGEVDDDTGDDDGEEPPIDPPPPGDEPTLRDVLSSVRDAKKSLGEDIGILDAALTDMDSKLDTIIKQTERRGWFDGWGR